MSPRRYIYIQPHPMQQCQGPKVLTIHHSTSLASTTCVMPSCLTAGTYVGCLSLFLVLAYLVFTHINGHQTDVATPRSPLKYLYNTTYHKVDLYSKYLDADGEDLCIPGALEYQITTHQGKDTSYLSGSLDVVFTLSREPLQAFRLVVEEIHSVPAVRLRQPRLLVVNKQLVTPESILAATRVHLVISQANIGREGLAYLTYIHAYYQELPKHVIFLQSLPYELPTVIYRLGHLFHNGTGMLALGWTKECNCDGINCGLPGRLVRTRELWGMFQQHFCPNKFWGIFNGQFAVSANRIRAVPIQKYMFLYHYLTRSSHHFIHDDTQHVTILPQYNFTHHRHTCDNTLALHTLERAWSFIFDCWRDTNVAEGYCQPPYAADCFHDLQCLDVVPSKASERVEVSDSMLV